jgi:hypothetical protein
MTVNMRRWGLGFFVRNGAAFCGLPLSLRKSLRLSVKRLQSVEAAEPQNTVWLIGKAKPFRKETGKAGLEKLKLCDCDGKETKVRIPQRGY